MKGSEIKRILIHCNECKVCQSGCPFLKQLDLTPKKIFSSFIEGQNVTRAAYSCAVCGLCDFICPEGLNPSKAFLELREALVNSKRGPLSIHRPMYTNMKWNSYTLYQDEYKNEISLTLSHANMRTPEGRFDSVFFPGCALATFAPDVTKETYDLLNSKFGNVGLSLKCCGSPLEELGLVEEFTKNMSLLRSDLDKKRSQEIITACPHCFHTLKRNLAGYQIRSVYELLKKHPFRLKVPSKVAIHDSCSFRYYPDQLDAIREMFRFNNVDLIELENNKVKTVCCGAGAGIALASPDISNGFSELIINDAKEKGVRLLATYCETCALKLTPIASKHGIKVTHVLDLISGRKQDYLSVIQKVQSMYSGPDLVRNLNRLDLSE